MLGHRIDQVLRFSALGLFLLTIPAVTRAADVSDQAGFFSADAIAKANRDIREIEKKSGHEVQIETFNTVPSAKIDAVANMDKKQRDTFMQNWVKERAQETKANGTLVLICKDPGHIETWSSRKLKDVGFTEADQNRIKNAMIDGFRGKDFDGALQDTVSEIGTAYTKVRASSLTPRTTDRLNQAPAFPRREMPVRQVQSSWFPVIFIVGIVLVGIFVISLLSRLFGGGNRSYGGGPGSGQPGYGQPGYGPGPGYGGGGGGGFLQNMAGGLFGAVAGNWLYNSFGGNSAHANESNFPGASSGGGFGTGPSQNDGGGDFTSGGDFGGGGGDSGGGGDFGGGGGDFGGGGDSGGGDFGGGGDF